MDILTLLDDDSSLVSFPSIYTQFQEAMADENSSFSEIGDIIVYDAVLSARLLRIVNSAYYGFSQKNRDDFSYHLFNRNPSIE